MDKHTLGPWTIKEDNGLVITSPVDASLTGINTYPQVCRVSSYYWGKEVAQANARLIAVSPELLGALKLILPTIDRQAMVYSKGDHGDRIYIFDYLKKLIAKAEGRE